MKRRTQRYACVTTILLLLSTTPTLAQPEALQRPWEREVTAENRRLAETLFAQAVELHEQLLRDQAAARYAEALSHWENPLIRWNLALVATDMGQYLRAYEHLERALAWGLEAFNEQERAKITTLRKTLLDRHLAVVEGNCDQPGAEVVLDGKPWFRGAGVARQVVLPGEHVITARKAGYFPVARNIVLPAGAQGEVSVSMSVDGILEKRRWQPWMPWTALGSGLAMGVLGAGLDWQAHRHLDQARRELSGVCGENRACDPMIPSSHRRSLWEHRIATGTIAVGGALVATGLVLVFLNQPRSFRTEDWGKGTFELVPLASPDTAGISVGFGF